jgi:hypothetical protein
VGGRKPSLATSTDIPPASSPIAITAGSVEVRLAKNAPRDQRNQADGPGGQGGLDRSDACESPAAPDADRPRQPAVLVARTDPPPAGLAGSDVRGTAKDAVHLPVLFRPMVVACIASPERVRQANRC